MIKELEIKPFKAQFLPCDILPINFKQNLSPISSTTPSQPINLAYFSTGVFYPLFNSLSAPAHKFQYRWQYMNNSYQLYQNKNGKEIVFQCYDADQKVLNRTVEKLFIDEINFITFIFGVHQGIIHMMFRIESKYPVTYVQLTRIRGHEQQQDQEQKNKVVVCFQGNQGSGKWKIVEKCEQEVKQFTDFSEKI